jgi:hypothetical protein
VDYGARFLHPWVSAVAGWGFYLHRLWGRGGCAEPHIRWVSGTLFPGGKVAGAVTDHLAPSSA